jgi:hypothetical protein
VAAIQAAGYSTTYATPSLRAGDANVTVAVPEADYQPTQCPGALLVTVEVWIFARGMLPDHLLQALDDTAQVAGICHAQGWSAVSDRGDTGADDTPAHVLTIERPI